MSGLRDEEEIKNSMICATTFYTVSKEEIFCS